MQDSAKSADEVLNSLIKYAKGQGENGVNNLQKIKTYLGEENNAFLEMQILNRLFKESVVENDRAKVRVFDSEGFLNRVRELVGENELYERNELNGLSSGKLKEILQSWDLSKENNANKKLRQIVSKVGNEEAKELSKHFDFKGKKPLVREIDSHQILHALKAHGDEEKELKRGQEALTLEDISEYENIVKNYDFKHIQDNGRIIYAKQVNGHHIVLEEVLSGQDKLRFFDMWKQKGQLNKEVLLSHSQRPNANLDQMTKRRMPSSDESITQPLFKSKEAREFLEELSPSPVPKQISIDEFLNTLENFKNKENFLKHIEKDPKRKDYLNLIEPTLKEPDIAFKKLENGVEKEKFIKKFSDGKDFFYLLATKDNKETILTAFKTDKINTILKEFNADIIPTFIRQGSKGKAAGTTNEGIITQPL
ncbi:TPA: hypothetical protein R1X64_001454, partial [Campylobacter upsaliensis]|nr:hypothetical protein [Campylobacter upsaliensis]